MANTLSLLAGVGGQQGITSLMNRPNVGLDFLAFARGQQMANDMSWQNRQRDIAAQQLFDWEENRNLNKAVQQYLAPLTNNMSRAVSAGEDPTNYFIRQRQQILDDPTFNQMDARAQNMVLSRFAEPAKLKIQQLIKSNRLADAKRLSDAFGFGDVDDFDIAVASGDPDRVWDAIAKRHGYGDNYWEGRDEFGNATVSFNNGPAVPKYVMAAYYSKYGPAGLWMAQTQIGQARDKQAQYDIERERLQQLQGDGASTLQQSYGVGVKKDEQPAPAEQKSTGNTPGGTPINYVIPDTLDGVKAALNRLGEVKREVADVRRSAGQTLLGMLDTLGTDEPANFGTYLDTLGTNTPTDYVDKNGNVVPEAQLEEAETYIREYERRLWDAYNRLASGNVGSTGVKRNLDFANRLNSIAP